jgi:Beta-propeller repeat/Bacterial Ig-like domain (group 2)
MYKSRIITVMLALISVILFSCFGNPNLVSISVTPVNPSIINSSTQPFTATGTYSDGTTKNVTSSVTWTSGTQTVSTINTAGLATGVGTGTATITATLGSISGTTTLTVTAPVEITPTWTRLSGVSHQSIETYGNGIAVDSSGNSYVTGGTWGNLDGQTFIGSIDAFVTKYNASGVKQWTRLSGVEDGHGDYTIGYGIALDPSGNIYIAGHTSGNLDGQTVTGNPGIFVIKYNSSGEKQWTRLLGAPGAWSYAFGIGSDSSGNIYVNGYSTGNFDGQTSTGSVGNSTAFVTKYNSSGEKQWTRLFGGTYGTEGYCIAVDSSGNSHITGLTRNGFDGQSITGSNDVFVVKYNSSGEKQWTKLLGVPEAFAIGTGTALDLSGNIYVTGQTDGNLDGQTLAGTSGVFTIKYNTNGEKQWTRLLDAPSIPIVLKGNSVAVDSSGNSYVSGYTKSNLDGKTLIGTSDAFTVKYNSSGNKQWTKLLGVSGVDTSGRGIAIDSSGNNYVTGYTKGNLDGQTLSGSKDMFVTTRFNQ